MSAASHPPSAHLRGHAIVDARSIAFHALIAEKIAARPGLLETARANVRRWQTTADRRLAPTLAEWEALLELPPPELLAFLTDPGERATRLRQSSPFTGILTTRERTEILLQFSPNRR
jgi:hypothetical protein